jgi:hypothetical protein
MIDQAQTCETPRERALASNFAESIRSCARASGRAQRVWVVLLIWKGSDKKDYNAFEVL